MVRERRTERIVWIALLGVHLYGCPKAHQVAIETPRESAAAGPLRPSWEFGPAQGVLRDRLELVAGVFRDRGARPYSDRWVTFVPGGTAQVITLALDRDRCVGLVAVSMPGVENVDLGLFNASGAQVALDNRSDAHPYVRVCARAGDRFQVIVEAVSGGAEVGFIAMTDPPVIAPNLDPVLGTPPLRAFTPPRTPRASVGDDPSAPTLDRSLENQLRRLSAQGYTSTPVLTLHGEVLDSELTSHALPLQAGHCYALAAVVEPGVDDFRVRVRLEGSEDGNLAEASGTDAPVLRMCPDRARTYQFELGTRHGRAQWKGALLEMDPTLELSPQVTGPSRARALELVAEARRNNLRLRDEPLRVSSASAVELPIPIPMRAGRCYLVGVAAGESVSDVDLSLLDERGAVRASDTAARSGGRVFFCPRRRMRARVKVSSSNEGGEFVVLVFEGPRA